MAVKELAFESEARAGLLAGVEKLAAAVKPTLGPRGRNAVIDKSWGGPTVTKDGVTVAQEIDLGEITGPGDPDLVPGRGHIFPGLLHGRMGL